MFCRIWSILSCSYQAKTLMPKCIIVLLKEFLCQCRSETLAHNQGLVIRCFVAYYAIARKGCSVCFAGLFPIAHPLAVSPSRMSRKGQFSCRRALLHMQKNIGSNSVSSSTSAPIAGQPKATVSKLSKRSGENSAAVNAVTSAPFAFAPSATAFAIASVLPVPLQ